MKDTLDTTAPVTAKPEVKPIRVGEYNGALGRFQTSAYGDLFCFGFTKQQAHKIALDFGPDLGNAMLKSDNIAAKVGKAKKDGDTSIKFSGSGSTYMTNSMAIIRVVQSLAQVKREGFIQNCKVVPAIEWQDGIASYLAKTDKWVTEQVWE